MSAIRELTEDILYRLQRSDDEELVDSVNRLSWWADAFALGDVEMIRQMADEGWYVESHHASGQYFVSVWDTDDNHDTCDGHDPEFRHALIKAYIDWREEMRFV